MITKTLFTAVAAGLAWSAAVAQPDPTGRSVAPEDLRMDLGIIRSTLEQAHPDPYRYPGKAGLDTLFATIHASLSTPLTSEEFIRAAMPVFRAVGDAATRLTPPAEVERAYEHSEPLIPFTVAVIEGRLYLDQELKGFRSLPTGCELLRINGRGSAEILALLRSGVVPEGEDTTLLDRTIEQDFPVMYRRFVESAERFKVEYRAGDGTVREQQVIGLTKDEMRSSLRRPGIDLQPWRMEDLRDLGTAWLTLSTMDRQELGRSRIVPERFLGQVQEALERGEVRTLVIDLRGSHGGDPAQANQVFALIAQKPFRSVSSMYIRSGEVPDSYRYATPAPEFFASVNGMYMPALNGRRVLQATDPRLRLEPPREKAFQGKVYVVCDGGTRDAAALLVMLANRTGRARTVGEETGSNAAGYCGGNGLAVTLPGTGCVLQVPLTCYVPEGIPAGPVERGELPVYRVPRQAADLALGRDTVREALLNLIAELQ